MLNRRCLQVVGLITGFLAWTSDPIRSFYITV